MAELIPGTKPPEFESIAFASQIVNSNRFWGNFRSHLAAFLTYIEKAKVEDKRLTHPSLLQDRLPNALRRILQAPRNMLLQSEKLL